LAVSQEVLLGMATLWMGNSRLLDCILICIANWIIEMASFTRNIAYCHHKKDSYVVIFAFDSMDISEMLGKLFSQEVFLI
jgi:hypothetical protein